MRIDLEQQASTVFEARFRACTPASRKDTRPWKTLSSGYSTKISSSASSLSEHNRGGAGRDPHWAGRPVEPARHAGITTLRHATIAKPQNLKLFDDLGTRREPVGWRLSHDGGTAARYPASKHISPRRAECRELAHHPAGLGACLTSVLLVRPTSRFARLSSKGQVILPSPFGRRSTQSSGVEFAVVDTAEDGVLLRPLKAIPGQGARRGDRVRALHRPREDARRDGRRHHRWRAGPVWSGGHERPGPAADPDNPVQSARAAALFEREENGSRGPCCCENVMGVALLLRARLDGSAHGIPQPARGCHK